MVKLSQSTTVSVGLLAIIIGGVVWLSSIFFQSRANAESIGILKQENSLLLDMVYEIKLDVRELKTKVNEIHERGEP